MQHAPVSTICNLIKCFIGIGIFISPRNFAAIGWCPSVIGSILIIIITSNVLKKILVLHDNTPVHLFHCDTPSYQQMAYFFAGRIGYILSIAFTTIIAIGAFLSYIIIILDTIKLYTGIYSLVVSITFSLFLFIMSCFHIHFVSIVSAVGFLCTLLVVGISIWDIAHQPYSLPAIRINQTTILSDYGSFIGDTCFLYLIPNVIIPVYTDVGYRHWNIFNIVIICTGIMTLGYGLTIASMFSDPALIHANVVLNVTPTFRPMVDWLLVFDMLSSIVLELYPFFTLIDREILQVTTLTRGAIFCRFSLISLMMSIVHYIPDFTLFTRLSGGLGCISMGIILPTYMYTQYEPHSSRLQSVLWYSLSVLLIVISLV